MSQLIPIRSATRSLVSRLRALPRGRTRRTESAVILPFRSRPRRAKA